MNMSSGCMAGHWKLFEENFHMSHQCHLYMTYNSRVIEWKRIFHLCPFWFGEYKGEANDGASLLYSLEEDHGKHAAA